MPLLNTSGNVTADAFGGGVAAVPNYIEEVFSTYLYTGNGLAQGIGNGIDLSGKGGLTWIKSRSAATNNFLFDTARGALNEINSNTTDAQASLANSLTAFNSSGFTLGNAAGINVNADTYVSWTFRKQPKFFDVVTYTGTGSAQNIAHNLGSQPGAVIIKATSAISNWPIWMKGGTNAWYIGSLDNTGALSGPSAFDSLFTSTTFYNGGGYQAGVTYVAYLFASNAGGFGLTGTDNVISCGSYTGNGSTTGPVINLGYEPQWLLIKKADSATTNTGWAMFDNMRGLRNSGGVFLYANSSAAEDSSVNIVSALATGFQPVQTGFLTNGNGSTYIYIAIRRGPMKVPTSGTSVFKPITWTGDNTASRVISGIGFPPDFANLLYRPGTTITSGFYDRLRGTPVLVTGGTNATQSEAYWAGTDVNMGAYGQASLTLPTTTGQWNANPITYVAEFFRRAPSFFDEVCWSGTGSYPFTVNHNLGVVPELMIFKRRNGVENWWTYAKPILSPNANWYQNYMLLNGSGASLSDTTAITSAPTSTTIPFASFFGDAGKNYVAYLFATCPGVSKVGSYTGTGATQTINCGFTGGARFVLIKKTDTTDNWYVWDTARGMVSGTDPWLYLNTTTAELNLNSIWTTTGGFQIVNPSIVNSLGGNYIFLAIA